MSSAMHDLELPKGRFAGIVEENSLRFCIVDRVTSFPTPESLRQWA